MLRSKSPAASLFSLGCVVGFVLSVTASCSATAAAQEIDQEFFEARIRPVLVERCYECHNSADQADGSLILDHREGLLRGGDRGAAIVPGNARESLLITAMHFDSDLRMPEGGPKLDEQIIRDFERWIDAGAPDPRDNPPTAQELAESLSWEAVRERRKNAWQFQSPTLVPAPEVSAATLSQANELEKATAIDRWLASALEQRSLSMASIADRNTLIRRLALVITGLPPTLQELDQFTSGGEATWLTERYPAAVDHYLASPAFGERWARHWMDWMRYADSHGSEGDPAIPLSHRYRDYLIRAINADVPIDQMVREQLAGDLLAQPRIDPQSQWNESLIGLGHWRMVQHGFAPVDPADERMRFTDNQIDVVSKAFLGLTVSCARCHDHKFDPISQRDFYAWYGIFASARPALVTINSHQQPNASVNQLASLHAKIRDELATVWINKIPSIIERLESSDPAIQAMIESATADTHPLHAWRELKLASDKGVADLQSSRVQQRSNEDQWRQVEYPLRWSFAGESQGPEPSGWFRSGTGLDRGPEPAGGFQVLLSGDAALRSIQQAGEYTHHLSDRRNGILTSPEFTVDFDELWIAVSGSGGAQVRFVVQNYPRVIGLLYVGNSPSSESPTWVRWDMRYWRGEQMHIELATAGDLPVGAQGEESRSWFGITEVVGRNEGQPEPRLVQGALFDSHPAIASAIAAQDNSNSASATYSLALRESIEQWRTDQLSSSGAEFLNYFVQQGLLPATLDSSAELRRLVEEYRQVESTLPTLIRSPGVIQAETVDRPLLARGELNQPQDLVPRGFLEAFSSEAFPTDSSGRLELANAIIDDNPLFARVMANRLWHYVFGRGIVATCDNFGHLGEPPTHPELLDLLALRLSGQSPYENGEQVAWSTKQLVRELVMTRAFMSSSYHADPRSRELDPDGRWLSRWQVRRLDAEAIRDSLLAITGVLNPTMYGPTVGGGEPRRSVYVRVQRNNLDPLLTVFDAPIPFSTVGARPQTNVPAQSLMLLNDPVVHQWARDWGRTINSVPELQDSKQRVAFMFRQAFAREPAANELESCVALLEEFANIRDEGLRLLEEKSNRVADLNQALLDLERPIRERLATEPIPATTLSVEPVYEWSFKDNSFESESPKIQLHGDARLEDGALVVRGSGWAQSEPFDRPWKARSMEAWVQLDNLDQQGGGVLTLETLDGNLFDSIVIGEQERGHWMAGSNSFQRTASFQAMKETEAIERAVHLIWVYSEDGTIRGYRDGESYGGPIRQSPLLEHAVGQSRITLGLRHSPASGNRFLKGRIFSAALFDRALSEEEIQARSQAGSTRVTRAQLIAAMNEEQRSEWERLRADLQVASQELSELQRASGSLRDTSEDWSNLALTLLNLKELIYLD